MHENTVMDELQDTVNALLRSVVDQNKTIAPNKHLIEDLGMDSLKMFELTVAIEDKFDVLIPVSRVAHIKTVADLYRAVRNLDDYVVVESKH